MAHVLRLRRALSLSTVLLSRARPIAAVTTLPHTPATATATATAVTRRDFHSSRPLCLSSASRSFGDMEKIDPDAILFEGCDYKHWLIVMDFGKDPASRPPPDQMVQTYVETAAKVIGSVEEAKRKIYACSTTTYTGFQVEVDEDTSKKFEDLPGVIFVLPDSYLDPVNKEYGGDKYINGEIIPRPPPVQYGRQRGFRPNDQRPRDSMPNQQGNQSYNQQRNPGFQQGNRSYNQQRNPGFQQGNPGYNQQGSMPQGGRGYPPQGPQQGFAQPQNFPPQQNYAPSGQAGRDEYRSGQRNVVPPQEGTHNNGFNRVQGQMSNQPGNHGGYAPPAGSHAYDHPQGLRSNNPGSHSGYAPPGQMGGLGDNRSNFSTPVGGAYGQTGPGSFEPSGAGQYRQSPNSDSFGRGAGYTPHGENQRFPPGSNQQSNPSEHGNYSPGAQTGFNQEEANFQSRKSNF